MASFEAMRNFVFGPICVFLISITAFAKEAPVAEGAASDRADRADDTAAGSDSAPKPDDAAAAESAGEAPVESDMPKTESEADSGDWVFSLFAKESYRYRYATVPNVEPSIIDGDGDSTADLRRGADQDLNLFLGADVRDAADRFAAGISLGLFADLDGFVSSGDPTALSSIYENNNDVASLVHGSPPALWFDVYSLFAEYHSDGLLKLARAGRQVAEHGVPVTFDGAAVDLRLMKPYLELFAYGGRSIHFFETDADLYEDWLASGGVQVRPVSFLKLELDYRFNAEDIPSNEALLNGSDPDATARIVDHGYGIAAWLHYNELLYLKGYFRGLGAAPAHAGGIFDIEWQPIELGFDLKADAQLTRLREVNELDDPYYAILGESLPHVRLNADLWKSFTTDMGIYTGHIGWAARILTADDPTAFNRDFGRVYISLDASDIARTGLFVGLVGEYYYTHAGSPPKDTFFSAGGSFGFENQLIKAEAGSYYQWFKYDYYLDVKEIEDVRTYFVGCRVRPLSWLDVGVEYELEQLDRYIHTAKLTLAERF